MRYVSTIDAIASGDAGNPGIANGKKLKQQRAIADWRQGRTIVHNASHRDSEVQKDN